MFDTTTKRSTERSNGCLIEWPVFVPHKNKARPKQVALIIHPYIYLKLLCSFSGKF